MIRIGSILMLLAILATPAQAKRQGRMRGPTRSDDIGVSDRNRDLPADMIIRFQERLSLSDEQLERVKDAQRSDREVRDALRLETREMRDRLRDGEITRAEFREEMVDRRDAEADGRVSYRETLEGILTDDQRSQLRSIRRQASRGRGMRGGRSDARRFRGRGQDSRGSRAQRGGRAFLPWGGR